MSRSNRHTLFCSTSIIIGIIASGCSGVRVIRPDDEFTQNAGTKMLDYSSGSVAVVSTYTCRLKSGGAKFSAVGKTEEEARKEVIARCHDRTVLSFCRAEAVSCAKN